MSCKNKVKQRCGAHTYAPCVKYEKDVPEWSDLYEKSCLDLEQTTEDLYNTVTDIKEETYLSDLGNECITYTTSPKVKDVLKKYETEICELKQKVQELETMRLCSMLVTGCGLDLSGIETECSTPITTFSELMNYILTKINE